MSRLIDADYMLHKMETTKFQPITEMEHYAFDFGKELLKQAPTADAVPKSVLEDIRAEIKECVNACEDLMSGKYPMIESEYVLKCRKLSYEQCLDIIDNHINGKEQQGEQE